MNHLQTFQVFPVIPEPLSFLQVLSRNLWWCWHLDAIELFRRINPRLWDESGRNPIVFSTLISQKQLAELSKDESFLAHQQRVKESFAREVLAPVDRSGSPYGQQGTIAYFSMEFGIHESVPLFAGGLGVLAGDHVKAASDLALPLVGVGILYRKGYFNQFLDQDGLQQEEYPETNFYQLPMKRAKDRSEKYRPLSGKLWLVVFPFTYSIPICLKTPRKLGKSLHGCMPETQRYGWLKRFSWESAG